MASNEKAELHKTIWKIANDLRGSVDGWDFKQYVLGTLFYRFISENLTNYLNEHQHKAGIKANTYARLYGERLMPELVADLKQPMSYSDAKYLEVDVAIKLRELGYAVWQA